MATTFEIMVQRVAELEAERDELRARLAVIEAQEPVAWMRAEWSGSGATSLQMDKPADVPSLADEARGVQYDPLYARPVPAIPAGWRLVPVEPTQKQWNAGCKAAREYLDEAGGNSPAVIYRAMVDEAPEYKAPAGGCGACGDACVNRRRCRLAEESPEQA